MIGNGHSLLKQNVMHKIDMNRNEGKQANGRRDWIRTSDLLVPNETRYQAALHSVIEPNLT